jgi:hypothetical protein
VSPSCAPLVFGSQGFEQAFTSPCPALSRPHPMAPPGSTVPPPGSPPSPTARPDLGPIRAYPRPATVTRCHGPDRTRTNLKTQTRGAPPPQPRSAWPIDGPRAGPPPRCPRPASPPEGKGGSAARSADLGRKEALIFVHGHKEVDVAHGLLIAVLIAGVQLEPLFLLRTDKAWGAGQGTAGTDSLFITRGRG